MQTLTMTRIVSDVDTVALMEYAEAENRSQYVSQFCRENYGEVPMSVRFMAGRAFKEAAQNMGITSARRRNYDYFSIGVNEI
jgi:hypothetical protein